MCQSVEWLISTLAAHPVDTVVCVCVCVCVCVMSATRSSGACAAAGALRGHPLPGGEHHGRGLARPLPHRHLLLVAGQQHRGTARGGCCCRRRGEGGLSPWLRVQVHSRLCRVFADDMMNEFRIAIFFCYFISACFSTFDEILFQTFLR